MNGFSVDPDRDEAEEPFDAQTARWIAEKHEPKRGADDRAIAGMAAAAEEARAAPEKPDDLFARPTFGAVDATSDPLPRRALRTDTKGWPGRAEFEAQKQAEAPEHQQPGRDHALDAALAPQLSMETGDPVLRPAAPGLADKFLVPPFSVLDTRAGYWQQRRRAWLSLGLRGETHAGHAYVPDSSGNSKREASGVYGSAKEKVGELKEAKTKRGAFNHDGVGAGRMVGEHLSSSGRSDGLLYPHSNPASDPDFYRNKTKAEKPLSSTGRSTGLIYEHTAPGSDPGFYDRKTAAEKELGRTLTTAEFMRDHYDRDEALATASGSVQTGTSVFDPVLCEIAYRWFSGEGAQVIDPFAGGAVRGVIAGVLRRAYTGIELRPEQIADNRLQAQALLGPDSGLAFGREPIVPQWVESDSTQMRSLDLPKADLIFTCPPYADLEVYSDDPRDLSTAPYATFRAMLSSVMAQSAERLKPDRFAVWVVGEARGKDGLAYGLIADTVRAAKDAGLALYNEAILLNSVGSAALRAQLIVRTRKLTRVHQHVLVFVKGDPKRAAQACGSAEVEK